MDLDGDAEVVAQSPRYAGYCIDWLPDGRLAVTGDQHLLRREADGSLVPHADLSGIGDSWNEIVVDGRGNIYTNNVGFRFGEEEFRPGVIALITPDGTARQVADDIAFPSGMVVTPDNSGGPVLVNNTNQIIAVVSFGFSPICHGADCSWRVDTQNSYDFILPFLG